MSNTIHVSNLSRSTTKDQVHDFFSFCGKITDLKLQYSSKEPNAPQTATVTFERASAAKTALLLDQTALNGAKVHVEAAHSLEDIAGDKVASHADEPQFGAEDDPLYRGEGIRQEDKPKAAILAELLGAGYAVADTALQKGIELDKKHGFTQKFSSYLNQAVTTIDSKLHATDKAKSMDHQYHVTDKLKNAQQTIMNYFEQALDTPTGKRLRSFYSTGEKQVLDIHNEAKRLAELKKQQSSKEGVFQGPEKTTCSCGGEGARCTCPPGKCACAGCPDKEKAQNDTPMVGTAAGGDANRQFGSAAQDIKGAAEDIATGVKEKA